MSGSLLRLGEQLHSSLTARCEEGEVYSDWVVEGGAGLSDAVCVPAHSCHTHHLQLGPGVRLNPGNDHLGKAENIHHLIAHFTKL